MNRIYQLVWNALHQAWVAVSEVASSVGSRSTTDQRHRPGVARETAWMSPSARFTLKTIAACAGGMCAGAVFLLNPGQVSAQTLAPTTLPQGGVVTQGAATLQGAGSSSAPVLNVNQTSQRAVVNWNSFNLGSAATVNFNQPNAQSATLNRVLDMNPSQIFGHINAPGQVTLVNPAGVYFSPSAVLDVGALTATTLGQTDADFMAGKASFQRNGATGSVVNEGTLKAADTIALLAPEVRNQGTITASAVVMAAGESIQLNFDAFSRLASLSVTPSQIKALVENKTAILAPGGLIILSATALRGLQASVIHSGQIDASSLSTKGGRIVLEGDNIQLSNGSSLNASGATGGGTVLVGGDWQGSGTMAQATTVAMAQGATIDASATQSGDGGRVVLWSDVGHASSSTTVNGSIAARGGALGGNGGQVETSGHGLNVSGSVDAGQGGQWLLDPTNIVVATSGGTTTPTVIESSLNTGTTVTLSTAGGGAQVGDITVTDPIASTGSGAGGITLQADNNIAVNANITLTGTGAGLSLQAKNSVVFNSNVALTTGGGNVLIASRAAGASEGYIKANNNLTINTSGGSITLGGGDAAASGYAIGSSTDINSRMGASVKGNATFNSGGGSIAMRGQAGTYDDASGGYDSYGAGVSGATTINSGLGTVLIDGKSANPGTFDYNEAVGFFGNASITSSNTTANAIRIVGDATGAGGASGVGLGTGISFFSANNQITASGAGGGITLQGKRGTTNLNDIYFAGGNIQAASGAINITGTSAGGLVYLAGTTLGAKAASPITSSNSNVTITGDGVSIPSAGAVNATGTLTVQPFSSSFTSALTYPGNLTVASTVSALTLGKVGNTADITVGGAQTIAGPINVYGGNLAVSANLTTTGATGGINLQAQNNVSFANNVALTTGGGDVMVATRIAGATEGNIKASNNLTIATSGGSITLGGGDSAASGYAIGRTGGSDNAYRMGVGVAGNADFNSGGGNIVVRGTASATTATNGDSYGVGVSGTTTLNSGTGTILLDGKSANTATNVYNEATGFFGTATIASANTTANAIRILGDATGAGAGGTGQGSGVSFWSTSQITASGAGGGITVQGTRGTTNLNDVYFAGGNIQAASGAINIAGNSVGGQVYLAGTTLGAKATSPITSSSSNVTVTSDVVSFASADTVDTTGSLTVQPFSTSFSSALAYPINNLTVANTLTGLTLGKLGNLANITVNTNQSINGPISIYGGNVLLNANLAATASGAMVKVLASNHITLASSTSVTTNAGAVLFNSDADGSGAGGILLNSNASITSTGGSITLGGGAAGDGSGNAVGFNTDYSTPTSGSYRKGVELAGATVNAGGGNITMRGKGAPEPNLGSDQVGIYLSGATVGTSGTGVIAMTGTGGAAISSTSNMGIAVLGSSVINSGGVTTLTGTGGTAGSSGHSGIQIDNSQVNGGSGLLTLSGTGGTSPGGGLPNAVGVSIASGSVSGGAGGVVVTGLGGTASAFGGGYNGVAVSGATGKITSTGGNVVVNGTGGTDPAGAVNSGVVLTTGGTISNTGIGNTTVTGTATTGAGPYNVGVDINGGSITSNSGAVSVTGIAGPTAGATNFDVAVRSAGHVSTTSGSIAITANSYGGDGTEAISAGTGTVTIQNRTAGTFINVGGDDVLTGTPLTLGLGTAELGRITAGTLVVGRNDGNAAGAMLVSSTLAPTGVANLVLKTGSTLAINAPITVNNTLTLSALGNVSQAVGGNIAATNLLLNGSGNYALATASSNAISTLAASLTGAISYKNSSALQIGTVDGVNGIISAGGPVSIGTANGDLTVARNVATLDASSNAVLLNAGIASAVGTSTGGNIVLGSSPAVTITTGIGGRTTLMTGAVGGSTGVTGFVVAGSGRFRYNSDESATNYTTALGSGAYAIYREAPTVHLSTGNVGITYGDALPSFSSTVTGAVNSDVVGATVAVGGAQSSSLNYTAGSHSLTPGSAAATALGYAIGTVTGGTLSVAQKTLTSSFTGTNRTYNGTTTAAVTATPSGIVSGDLVAVVNTGANFANKNVGIGKAIAITGVSLSSADKDNYTIASTGSASANVQAADVSFTTSAVSRGYNGALGAAGTATVASGTVFSGDTFSGGTFAFTDKNVGTGKTVTTSGVTVTDGNGGGNYNISYANNTASSIGQANITLATSAVNKVYDSGVGALGTAIVTSGPLFSGDSLSGGTFAFTDKNVGTGKTVTTSGVTVGDGVNNSNYAISYANNTASTITKANLAVGGITANNKTYDATTSATLSGTATISALGSDVVALGGSGSGSFADKNVGTGKAVTTTGYSLSGSDAGNYTLLQPTGLSANITKADLAVGGITANNKTYDATTSATLSGTATVSALGSDVVALGGSGSGSFADKNVGTGKAVTTTGYSLSGSDAGNYTLLQPTGLSANITKADLAVGGITANNKTYDATTSATLSGTATVSALGSDVVALGGSGSGSFADKNVGTGKAVTTTGYSLSGADAGNYNLLQPTGLSANITKADLAVSGITANNKTYDATTSATLSGTATVSALGSDVVALGGSGSGSFADKNVGTGKAVTTTGYSLSGSDAGNYTLVQPTGLSANITKADLAVGGITANNKTYDATTSATLSGTATVSALGSDVVALGGSGSGSFADKNVGTGKAVTTTGYSLSGSDAGNYNLLQPTGLSANITKADLAVGGITANNKTYDATTSATLSGTATVSALGSDVVALGGSGSGSFADKNVGTGKAVTTTGYSLSGSDAGNYTLLQPTGLSANITKADLAVGGITANNKTYDATTSATLSGTATVSALGSDVVALGGSGSGSFADKNVGTGKAVTTTGYSLSGSDAGNYTLLQPTGLSANITKADLAVGGITANNKTYDATTSATLSGTATISALGSDVVALGGSGSGSFADKNVGTGKAVTTTGYSLSGSDAGNYTLLQPTGLSANITKADLAVGGITANNKTYDATTSATLSGTATVSALGSDVVALGGSGSGSFADKNVGTGKAVTTTGYSLSGSDAGNYTLLQPTGLSANITKADLAVSGITANNKTYDATTSATLNGTATISALGSDVVALGGSGSGSFADKNVGTGKAVTTTGYSLSGADAGNYNLLQPTGLSANITKADLAVSGITANNKTYDATTSATLSGTATVSALGSDVVALGGSGSGSFADKNVGTGKAVTTTGYSLSGSDAGNYTLVQPTGLTANITKADLAVSGITANNKTYDATTSATLSGTATISALGSDVVALGGSGSGSFADKNVGTGKAVTTTGYSLSGSDAGNYTLVQPTGLSANITKADLAVGGITANNKTYDATTSATLSGTATVSALGSDVVALGGSGSGSFADKNVGTGKAVTTTGYSLSGADAGNYNLLQPTGLTANITKATVTVSGITADNKTYDGSTSATVRSAGAVYTGLVTGETLSTVGSGTFSDKNAATGKTVILSGTTTATGTTSLSNYDVTEQATTTADITRAALTVTAPLASKTYDGNTNATGNAAVGSLAGGAAGEHVGLAATVVYTDKNAGAGNKTTRAAGLTVVDSSGTDVTANYAVNYVDNTGSTITPAALTVTANADARFVTLTDVAGYYGAHYDGLVGGETSSVLGGSLAITRSNAGTGAAGTYTGTLVPSGLTSGNYSIRYAPGTYTIVPANELLVRLANTSTVYGSTPTLNVTSVQYLAADGHTIMNLIGGGAGNTYSYTDGVGGSITFIPGPQGAGSSGAGKTLVGNYALADAAPAVGGHNFDGSPVFIGNLAVTPKPVTPTAAGVTKTYNGATDMPGLALNPAGQEAGDSLQANGSGAFAFRNVGSNLPYVVRDIALAGGDAGNYYLAGGNSLTGSNGSITPAPLTLSTSNVVKTYDGTTTALGHAVVTVGTLFGSDSIAGGSFAFTNKNAGLGNKTVTTAGVAVVDGNGGNNYTVGYANNTTSTITPAAITVTTSNVSKPFDGTTSAAGTAVLAGGSLFGTDHLSGGTFAFTDPNVGDNKTVLTSGVGIDDGNGGGNYAITYANNGSSRIVVPTVPASGVWTQEILLPHPPVVPASPEAPANSTLDAATVVAGAAVAAPGAAGAMGCVGTSQSGLDCERRDVQNGYVVVTPVRNVSPVLAGQVLVQVIGLRNGAFEAALPLQASTTLRAQPTPATAALPNGQPLPAWLRFDPQSMVFTAQAVPAKAMPLTTLVWSNSYRVEVEISEIR